MLHIQWWFNTLRPRQNGRHFADDTFNRIFVNENIRIWIEFSLKFVPKGPINNIPALVQIMAWRRPGDKPLSGPMLVNSLTHICVTRPQWVKNLPAKSGEELIAVSHRNSVAILDPCYTIGKNSSIFSLQIRIQVTNTLGLSRENHQNSSRYEI